MPRRGKPRAAKRQHKELDPIPDDKTEKENKPREKKPKIQYITKKSEKSDPKPSTSKITKDEASSSEKEDPSDVNQSSSHNASSDKVDGIEMKKEGDQDDQPQLQPNSNKTTREALLKSIYSAEQDNSSTDESPNIPNSFDTICGHAAVLYTTFLKDFKEKALSSERVIDIPLEMLSPNSLQSERFPRSNPQNPPPIKALITDKALEYLAEIIKDKSSDKALIRGPKGVGRSHLLALAVLTLRESPTNRVLYINNPELCKKGHCQYIRNEIVYCFFRDSEDLPEPPQNQTGANSLERWFNYMSQPRDRDKFQAIIDCLSALKDYCDTKKTKIIFVIDQENILQRLRKEGDFAERQFVNDFDSIFSVANCHRKLISASDNNEHYRASKDTPQKYIPKLFSPSDCVLFLNQCWNSTTLKLATPENDQVEEELNSEKSEQEVQQSEYCSLLQIIQFSKQSPLELKFITDLANTDQYYSFESLFAAYFKERVNYYLDCHTKYCATLEKKKDILESYEIATVLDTGYPLNTSSQVYNRDLIVKVNVPEEGKSSFLFESVCLAASKAIEQYYVSKKIFGFSEWFSEKKDYINQVIEYIIKNPKSFTASMYGGALEKLVLLKMAVKNQFNLNYWTASSKVRNLKSVPLTVDFVKYFDADKLYSSIQRFTETSPGKSALFIPNSPIYSLVDCILLEAVDKKYFLYLFQITININSHYKGDKEISSQINPNEVGCKHNICQVTNELINSELIDGYIFIWVTSENNITNVKKDIESKSLIAKLSDNMGNLI